MGASSPPLNPKLFLEALEPFAKGGHRHCYVDPQDADPCVKVPARADDARCHAERQRELKDSASLMKRGSRASLDRISAIEGIVATDLGVGIVQRLCRDADGRISRNCADIIRGDDPTPCSIRAIDNLKQWLRDRRLTTRGLTRTHRQHAEGR